jgi:hypothetical protein
MAAVPSRLKIYFAANNESAVNPETELTPYEERIVSNFVFDKDALNDKVAAVLNSGFSAELFMANDVVQYEVAEIIFEWQRIKKAIERLLTGKSSAGVFDTKFILDKYKLILEKQLNNECLKDAKATLDSMAKIKGMFNIREEEVATPESESVKSNKAKIIGKKMREKLGTDNVVEFAKVAGDK